MTQPQHTQGEWKYYKHTSNGLFTVMGAGSERIATAYNESNAQLIAKAYLLPELVDALEGLLTHIDKIYPGLSISDLALEAKEAINKYREASN